MSNSDRIVTAIAAGALFAVLMASPIEFARAAAQNAGAPSITLQFPQADLDNPTGVARLYRRIHVAAESVCSPYDSVFLEEKRMWDQCVERAESTAVASVHSARLSAYYWHRTGRRERPTSLAAR